MLKLRSLNFYYFCPRKSSFFVFLYKCKNSNIFTDLKQIKNFFYFSVNNAGSTFIFTLPQDFAIELSGNYMSKSVYGMADMNERKSIDIVAQKMLFERKTTLKLSVSDVFNIPDNIYTAQSEVAVWTKKPAGREVKIRMKNINFTKFMFSYQKIVYFCNSFKRIHQIIQTIFLKTSSNSDFMACGTSNITCWSIRNSVCGARKSRTEQLYGLAV